MNISAHRPPKLTSACLKKPMTNARGEQSSKLPTISQKQDRTVCQIRGQDIFEVEDVLTPSECENLIKTAEYLKFEEQTSRGPAFGEAVRCNDRIAIKSQDLADRLWANTGLKAVFADIRKNGLHAIGLNPNVRFYRYRPGHKFGKHIDESNRVGKAWTKFTLLIYLSGQPRGGSTSSSVAIPPVSGGETMFYDGRRSRLVAKVCPQAGLALLHVHGDECLEHEGAQVTAGVKYVLRSDVLFA